MLVKSKLWGQVMNTELSDLLIEINILRAIMMEIANKQGFSSPDTLMYSQRLDEVIYEYQIAQSCNINHEFSCK